MDIRTCIHDMMKKSSNNTTHDLDIIVEEIEQTKKLVPMFIENCANEIVDHQPQLVGFSTSYYQNCSSLCVAKRIKEKIDIPIVFGGANCEGEMGFTLLCCFSQIDYVCSGDGDNSFIEFVKCLLREKSLPKINGILTRESTPLEVRLTDPLLDMNSSPVPNFNDYFESIERGSLKQHLNVMINLETSRGCWWGESSHCMFCGLNGSTMKFRKYNLQNI